MSDIEQARLIPVSGGNDQPDTDNAIWVQFNPTTLKVALSNTLKANDKDGQNRATQYVDKSSSTLTVELVFDTTRAGTNVVRESREAGSDVRQETRRIIETFMIREAGGENEQKAPKRCRFQWGAFAFVGIIGNFDETLDFFSPEGQPLRSTVALKLSEDRYQHVGALDDRDRAQSEAEPTLTATGGEDAEDGGDGDSSQQQTSVSQAQSEAGGDPRDWRRTALFNGVESPRLPGGAALSVPRSSAGGDAGAGFRFGASASVGTGISRAFSAGAGGTSSVSPGAGGAGASGEAGAGTDAGIGFD